MYNPNKQIINIIIKSQPECIINKIKGQKPISVQYLFLLTFNF